MINYDLRQATFDQFLHYLFVDAALIEEDDEYRDAIVQYDGIEFVKLYTELFSDPTFVIDRYSQKQLEKGFWSIQGCLMEGSVCDVIYDVQILFDLRKLCIESMFSLYDKLFSIPMFPIPCDMWWDGIAYDYCCGNRSRNNEDERKLQDVMFALLSRILALSSEPCQYAALHGLGHLRHPDTEQLIENFLQTHRSFEGKDYARACITGKIM